MGSELYRLLCRRSSAQGQNEKPPFSGLCQLLPPAPDIGLPMLPPPCAKSGCEQSQQGSPLFDNLVGPREQHRLICDRHWNQAKASSSSLASRRSPVSKPSPNQP